MANRKLATPPTKGDVAALIWAGCASLISANYIGPYIFLVCKIGWAAVFRDHVRILAMPKGSDVWPLSNGGAIRDGFFIEFLIDVVCWLALTIIGIGLASLVVKRWRRTSVRGAAHQVAQTKERSGHF